MCFPSLLLQTFLPMVIQKSTTDAIQVLERYPSLSTAQHEELPKQEILKQETAKPEPSKQETPKLETSKVESPTQEPINQTSTPQENLKKLLHKSPETQKIVSENIPEIQKVGTDKIFGIPKDVADKSLGISKVVADKSLGISKVVVDKSLGISKVVANKSLGISEVVANNSSGVSTVEGDKSSESGSKMISVNPGQQRTLLHAFILDMVQVQRRLMVLISEGRVWLLWRVLGDRVGPPHGMGVTWVKAPQLQPQPKETIPTPLILPELYKKKDSTLSVQTDMKETKREEKTEEKPQTNSNLWEAIQDNSPEWQKSISNQLGKLQKVVVEKLSK